jgi:DNA-directed RNA polymerase subunit RPC12/RpoP
MPNKHVINIQPPPDAQRRRMVYALECWRCHRAVELPASARPYHCLHCGAMLLIEWNSGS